MPRVRRVDNGTGDTQRDQAQAGVCEPPSLLDARVLRRPDWPFLYTFEEGRCFINPAPRRSKAAQAEDVGEALI